MTWLVKTAQGVFCLTDGLIKKELGTEQTHIDGGDGGFLHTCRKSQKTFSVHLIRGLCEMFFLMWLRIKFIKYTATVISYSCICIYPLTLTHVHCLLDFIECRIFKMTLFKSISLGKKGISFQKEKESAHLFILF